MSIGTVTVRNFKSLEELELDLGMVNVLIGANCSGKSNFLEAIGILSAAANGRVDDVSLLARGVRPGVQRLYKCAFPGVRAHHIEFQATAAGDPSSVYRVSLFNPIVKGNYTWQYLTEFLGFRGEKLVGRSHRSSQKRDFSIGLAALKLADPDPAIPDAAFNIIRDLQSYAIYAPTTPVLRGIASDASPRPPIGLGGGNIAEALREFQRLAKTDRAHQNYFQGILDDLGDLIDWSSAFAPRGSEAVPVSASIPHPKKVIRFTDRFMRPNRNALSGYDASEGALYILFHALLASLPTAPAIYAVDNADHALNPRLCQTLFSRLCRWILESPWPKQVFLTTHNPMSLNGLPLLDERVRLFTVSRSLQGKTIIRRVQWNDELEEKRLHAHLTLSDLWLSGVLGGMPDGL